MRIQGEDGYLPTSVFNLGATNQFGAVDAKSSLFS
jgi:hypothetical protein